MDMEKTLRTAIKKDPRSLYRLALDCGVDVAILQRFVGSERTVTLRTADKICKALGMTLQKKRERRSNTTCDTPQRAAKSYTTSKLKLVRGR